MKHLNLQAALNWVKQNGQLSEGSIMIPPTGVKVGDTFKCVCTGAVHTSETRQSREDRKTNPALKPTFYIAREFSKDGVLFNSLFDGVAGQHYNVTAEEGSQTNPRTGDPYMELKFQPVDAKSTAKSGRRVTV